MANEALFEGIRRLTQPDLQVQEDIDAVYKRGGIIIGYPDGVGRIVDAVQRENMVLIVGVQLGDEGKGRGVDNKIEHLLNTGMEALTVVRFQGGSNAGHTIYSPQGEKIALHQVPSGILYEEVVGVMDAGMVINMEDLKTEITDAEAIPEVGDLRGKLILNPDAMLSTDLERAQEVLNRELSGGKSKGGTAKGISPTVANRTNRRGFEVGALFQEDWRESFGATYDIISREFEAHGYDLSDMNVPDLEATRKNKTATSHKVGTKEEFLDRLEDTRKWFIEREDSVSEERKMLKNTFKYHGEIYQDTKYGILFEGAQAIGLDPKLGRYPDVTSTPTHPGAVMEGTKFPGYTLRHIPEVIGVAKLTYMSSVGEGRMITDSGLIRAGEYTEEELLSLSDDQLHALWIRKEAHEYGTTTGRPRDICFLDLPLLRYNISTGVNQLAFTHTDIAKEDVPIKVCTHYVNSQGEVIPYQPGLDHQKGLTAVFTELPGWDGEAAARARTIDELPENARMFLAFMQRTLGTPITMISVGPKREELIVSG